MLYFYSLHCTLVKKNDLKQQKNCPTKLQTSATNTKIIMCCSREFWMSPAGLKWCYFFVVLNILGFIGWIAGCIYVTVDGQNNNLWMWAMPWQHLWPLGGVYRMIQQNKRGENSSEPCALRCSNKA